MIADKMDAQQNSVKISPHTLRNFIRRINNSAVIKKYREDQLSEISDRMKSLSDTSYEPKPSRKKMDNQLEALGTKIKEFVDEEKVLIVRQKNEQSEIDELKRKIAMLEEKLEGMGHVHSFVTEAHEQRIARLQDSLLAARIAERRTPEEEIRKFIIEKMKPGEEAEKREIGAEKKQLAKEKKQKKVPASVIKSLKKRISDAEDMYRKLARTGHHKEQLERLKETIGLYKERLGELGRR